VRGLKPAMKPTKAAGQPGTHSHPGDSSVMVGFDHRDGLRALSPGSLGSINDYRRKLAAVWLGALGRGAARGASNITESTLRIVSSVMLPNQPLQTDGRVGRFAPCRARR
jgi:hypothetical protein